MEQFQSLNSIQIDEFLKNKDNVFELEELWLSDEQYSLFSEVSPCTPKKVYPLARAKIDEIMDSFTIKDIEPILTAQKHILLGFITSEQIDSMSLNIPEIFRLDETAKTLYIERVAILKE